ncbi:hypothetical protein PMIN06_008774 [Paraphaeosphaeria minitans]
MSLSSQCSTMFAAVRNRIQALAVRASLPSLSCSQQLRVGWQCIMGPTDAAMPFTPQEERKPRWPWHRGSTPSTPPMHDRSIRDARAVDKPSPRTVQARQSTNFVQEPAITRRNPKRPIPPPC